jgi:opacity protein-like surface antigen
MHRKLVLALLLAVFAAGGAFAQVGMSAGGGLLFDLSGNNGIKMDDYYEGTRNTSIGAFAFFDVTYAEIDLYLAYGSLASVAIIAGDKQDINSDYNLSAMQFGFSILGKYPVDMGQFTIFPLFGIDYNAVLSVKDKEGNKIDGSTVGDMYSQFGFLAGAGADIKLSGSLFVRLEGLLHIRLPSKTVSDSVKEVDSVKATLGFGPQIKIAIGYGF